MLRLSLLAAAAVLLTASAAAANDIYYPGVDQPPVGGVHWTYGPALIYNNAEPDAHAVPGRFNAWGADAKPPLVWPAPAVPRATGYRGLLGGFRPQPAETRPKWHWHSQRFGY